MSTFRVSVKSLIEEERKDLAKEFGVPVHLILINKVVKKTQSKRANNYESKKQKRKQKVFNKKEKTNIKKNLRVGNNKKRLVRRK
jgi:hypothetical protein